MHDSPDTANRDLGAGQTQAARSGSSGRDAARAPSGHGCPFGAGPRSVVGVRVPDAGGPNQEPGTFGYFWCLFKSDPPEGRKGESAPPEKMDLPTLPMPTPANPTNPPTANLKTVRRSEADRCVAFDSAGGVALARDLPGTGSKPDACGVSGITKSSDFAAAARQIAGQATLLQGGVKD